jgi:hypothetical protein
MNDFFNEVGSNQARKPGDYYLQALRALIAGREGETSTALNNCRSALLGQRHGSTLCDADLQLLSADLDTHKFNGLYGDYAGKGLSPWVRQPDLLAMVRTHLAALGDPEDVQAFDAFYHANQACFAEFNERHGLNAEDYAPKHALRLA